MPKRKIRKTGKPTALHSTLRTNLQRLFRERGGLSIKRGMEGIGSSQQHYNQLQHGASPTLRTIEEWAESLKTSVDELLSLRKVRSDAVKPTIESLMDAVDDWGEAAGVEKPTDDKEFLTGLTLLWAKYEERLVRRRGGQR